MDSDDESDIPVDFEVQNPGEKGKGARKSTRSEKTQQYGKLVLFGIKASSILYLSGQLRLMLIISRCL